MCLVESKNANLRDRHLHQKLDPGLQPDQGQRGLERFLQGSFTPLDETSPLHHGQVRRLRKHRQGFLQAHLHSTKGHLLQELPVDDHLLVRLLGRYLLRRRFSPRRRYGIHPQQKVIRRPSFLTSQEHLRRNRFQGTLERSWCKNYHGRYPHWSPVVDLRLIQGRMRSPNHRWKVMINYNT